MVARYCLVDGDLAAGTSRGLQMSDSRSAQAVLEIRIFMGTILACPGDDSLRG